MSRYYDRDGTEITADEWTAKRRQTDEYRRVAVTTVDDKMTVSTVWLGLDHNWGGGPPLIFETLVFDGPMDGEMARYSTEAEAVAGHEAMVKRVQSARHAVFGAGWVTS
jgi:hypothetical protein